MGGGIHTGADAGRGRAGGALRALALANVRYWPTVAPHVHRQLARWQAPASEIPEPALRRLALAKLSEERFNAEVAATLATLAPRPMRAAAVEAIVALELLFDYLDGRTEPPFEDPLAGREALFAPFIDALEPPATARERPADLAPAPAAPDLAYLNTLSVSTARAMLTLPSAAALAASARAAAERCAQAQSRLHAVGELGERQLQDWARRHGAESGLPWREYTAGCASSVLAVHALIAAAADPASNESDARRIDAAYLAIGAVITILDSVVDRTQDSAHGRAGFIGLYAPGELPGRMRTLTREALARTREAPHGDHHAMTLAGVVAYYTSHPGAREEHARELVRVVRGELSPTIWPALAVMRSWRAAKSARSAISRRRRAVHRGKRRHRRAAGLE
jgi:tetraprenyl-beta-curcumene synthase